MVYSTLHNLPDVYLSSFFIEQSEWSRNFRHGERNVLLRQRKRQRLNAVGEDIAANRVLDVIILPFYHPSHWEGRVAKRVTVLQGIFSSLKVKRNRVEIRNT
jgi:hypothetical protein